MVYAAEIGKKTDGKKGKRLTFQVSGLLWNRSLVMRDIETKSLWSHILGECMEGELKGTQLEIIPCAMTTWADWKAEHPKTTVLDLSRKTKNYGREFYRQLDQFVLGAVLDGEPVAYPFDLLKDRPVYSDEIDGDPVLVVFDSKSTRATLFGRKIGERTLSFQAGAKPGTLIDRETKSVWNSRSGKCEEGELKGKQLEVLPAIVSYRHTWEKFHPRSKYPQEDG